MEIQMDFKDHKGNWVNSMYTHKSPNGCSSFKRLMGKAWLAFLKGFGIKDVNCPIKPVNK